MRRNDTLVTLANVMENCNVQDLKCSCVFNHCNHCSMCVNELADKAISILQRLLDKPEMRSCRIPLAIDFERMTNLDFWLKSKVFSVVFESRNEDLESIRKELREKIVKLVEMLRELQMKILQVDADYAEKLFKRMTARLAKSAHNLDYKLWRLRHKHPTMKELERQQVQLTANMLIEGILAYDEMPTGDEIAEVKLELVKKGIKHGQQLPDGFDVECAKLRRYSYWKGGHLFMINYQLIYTYLFSHCFEKFTEKQRIALYEYDLQLKMIHEDMMKLKPELANLMDGSVKHHLMDGSVKHRSDINKHEPHEDLFHFIHPSVSGEREWEIHEEVKRLVKRQGIQEICRYLFEMEARGEAFLPQMTSVAYVELVRMGMPNGEGYSEKYFAKHYKRN